MTERITRDEMLLRIAEDVSERGTCSRASVGAIISYQGRVLSTGYNGAPAKMPHCAHPCDCGYPGGGGLVFEGKHLSNCKSLKPCEIAVHAEVNCIAFAARHGVATEGAELHTSWSPCVNCCKLIVNAGLVRVVYRHEYRVTTGLMLLGAAGIEIEHLPSALLA